MTKEEFKLRYENSLASMQNADTVTEEDIREAREILAEYPQFTTRRQKHYYSKCIKELEEEHGIRFTGFANDKIFRRTQYAVATAFVGVGLATLAFGCGKSDENETMGVASNGIEEANELIDANKLANLLAQGPQIDDNLIYDINEQDARIDAVIDFISKNIENGIYYDTENESLFRSQIEATYNAMIKLNISELSIRELADIYGDKYSFRTVNKNANGFMNSIYEDIRYHEEDIDLSNLASTKIDANDIKEIKELVYSYFENQTSENRKAVIDYLMERVFHGDEIDNATFEMMVPYINAFYSNTRNHLTTIEREHLDAIIATSHVLCQEYEGEIQANDEQEIGALSERMLETLRTGNEKFEQAVEYAIDQNIRGSYNVEISIIYSITMDKINTGELQVGQLHNYEVKKQAEKPTGGSTLKPNDKVVNKESYVPEEKIQAAGGTIEQYEEAQKQGIEEQLAIENSQVPFEYGLNEYAQDLRQSGIDFSGTTEETQDKINYYDDLWNRGYQDAVIGNSSQSNDSIYRDGYYAGIVDRETFKDEHKEETTYEDANKKKEEVIEQGDLPQPKDEAIEIIPPAPEEDSHEDEFFEEVEEEVIEEVIESGEFQSRIDMFENRISGLQFLKQYYMSYGTQMDTNQLGHEELGNSYTLKA